MPGAGAVRATPWPVPPGARDVLLFGGMFDPPHRAHIGMAVAARDRALGPGSWLVMVPAARSPLRESGPVASDDDRLAMLRLATAGRDRVEIWTDELDRAGDGRPSYWIDTVRRASEAAPKGTRLRFLIGADQAVDFHRWREPREILTLAEPVVVPRESLTSADAIVSAMRETGTWSEPELLRWRARVIDVPLDPASSTSAREALRRGDEPAAAGLLDSAVAEYIRKGGLYRPPRVGGPG